MAFTWGHHAHGPSPQPTECRPLVCTWASSCSRWWRRLWIWGFFGRGRRGSEFGWPGFRRFQPRDRHHQLKADSGYEACNPRTHAILKCPLSLIWLISIICSGWLGTFPTVDSYTIKTKQHDVGNDNDNKGCDLCRSEQALLSYLLSPFCIKIFTTLQN